MGPPVCLGPLASYARHSSSDLAHIYSYLFSRFVAVNDDCTYHSTGHRVVSCSIGCAGEPCWAWAHLILIIFDCIDVSVGSGSGDREFVSKHDDHRQHFRSRGRERFMLCVQVCERYSCCVWQCHPSFYIQKEGVKCSSNVSAHRYVTTTRSAKQKISMKKN